MEGTASVAASQATGLLSRMAPPLEVAQAVPDPEIPVLTLGDLGVVRSARLADDGTAEVAITPTYSGCPAVDTMRSDITAALIRAGYEAAKVCVVLQPAWSTDWITSAGRSKLAGFGIAPPRPSNDPTAPVACPQCASPETRLVTPFGPTPCQSQRHCAACNEPFHHFKELT
jgi:ring-1,2-phenylacetyl-CoA epoxidase subunit PaaD